MSPRRILAMLHKDLRDGWRDGRIVLLLLMPVLIALIPAVSGGDTLPTAKVVVVDQGDGGVIRELRRAAGKSVKIEVTRASDIGAARTLIADEEAELAVVIAPTARAAARPEILVAAGASPSAQAVVALVPDALERAAGGVPAVQAKVRTVAPTNRKPVDVVGTEAVTTLFAIVALLTFIAMMIVPMQTAEELETGTFGALRLAAKGTEILAAKALVGGVLGAVGVGLIVILSGLDVDDPLLFSGAALALMVSLVSFGLLLALLVPNSNTINTYAAFLLTPLILSAIAVYLVDSGIWRTVLDVLPFSQAAKLLGDGASDPDPFHAGAMSWLVIAAWAAAGYAALVRIAARREV